MYQSEPNLSGRSGQRVTNPHGHNVWARRVHDLRPFNDKIGAAFGVPFATKGTLLFSVLWIWQCYSICVLVIDSPIDLLLLLLMKL